MKRREFIQRSAMAASVLALPSFLHAESAKKAKIGLQLYTLRDTITKDPKGVLQKVASFGYKELETFAYHDGQIFGLPFAEFGKFVKDLGMQVTSGHYPLELIKSDKWEQAVTDAKAVGQTHMVMPFLQEKDRKSLDDYKSVCAALNKAAEVCKKYKMDFGYHNHAFEFDKMDGQVPYDVMLKELDPKQVSMELDLFWIIKAGYDPLTYFAKYPGRFNQWHVKDMDKADSTRNANVGNGSIDFKPIFAKAKLAGLQHYYIEHDNWPGAPIDSVEQDIKYLKTIL
jgi:sugar phosphate isomerase/epimerase